ncbi:MAG: carbon-nitrogen hydrolase family protein [Undibacterium sp.]|uniref:carbon-nitrogen hydrolase family protein n=1 Tax=Undibacterium sp. TaxID=1914977 RepID=UPI0027211794|nr:carbon-nitrogen hydrolase family protein [Undibacterium sp.]MDO8654762.1 carbon-nitrogen hydrolase family protein [Undibacterium sp.]
MTFSSLPKTVLRIGAAQTHSIAGDITANVALAVALIEAGAADQLKLLVFSEKFLSGYEPDLIQGDPQRYAFSQNDSRLQPVLDACRRTGVAAIVGAASYDEQTIYISSLIISGKGELLAIYHKQHLFGSERAIFCAGAADGGCILELADWRLSMAICYDSGFPEHARSAALAGSHVYVVSALFSTGGGYHESRIWMPARALDNTMFVLMSNHVGSTGGWNTCGSSAIWGPYGNLLAEGSVDQVGLISCTLDPALLLEARSRETMLADYSAIVPNIEQRFKRYRLD